MRVVFTSHAVARYIERVRPGIEPERAEGELEALARAGRIGPEAPPWVAETQYRAHYFLVCGDLAFPIYRRRDRYVAVTCATRGTLAPGTRAARNERRRVRSDGRQGKRAAARAARRRMRPAEGA